MLEWVVARAGLPETPDVVRTERGVHLGASLRWKARLRDDGWGYETLESTDDDQKNPVPAHLLRLRNELSGPFDVTLFDRPLGWTAMLGCKHGLGDISDSLGYDDYFELAATLRIGGRPVSPGSARSGSPAPGSRAPTFADGRSA